MVSSISQDLVNQQHCMKPPDGQITSLPAAHRVVESDLAAVASAPSSSAPLDTRSTLNDIERDEPDSQRSNNGATFAASMLSNSASADHDITEVVELTEMSHNLAPSPIAPPSECEAHVNGDNPNHDHNRHISTGASGGHAIRLPSALCTPKEDNNLTIVFRDVSHSVLVPQHNGEISTFISPIANIVKGIATCGAAFKKREFYRCRNISGVVKPGTMTLVLSPPGHGKSTYLRMLAHRVEAQTGHLLYNGRTFDDAAQEGIDVRKMIQYVDQVDTHLPLLTVTETLDFAHKMSSVQYNPDRVEAVINMLGLEECRDTIIGNALIRGVSGGQRKRVSIGEMLVSDACTLLLDEFTNGLDTATSEDIGRALRQWCIQTNGSIVATLQQPTPGMFELFDRVVVLREGNVVYDGPQVDMLPYFDAMGFKCPDDVDVCDFIIDCLSQPRLAVMRQRELQLHKKQRQQHSPQTDSIHIDPHDTPHSGGSTVVVNSSYGPVNRAPTPCISTEEMSEFFNTTPFWEEIRDIIDTTIKDVNTTPSTNPSPSSSPVRPPLAPTPLAKDKFKNGLRLPMYRLLPHVLTRQAIVLFRNKGLLIPRLISTVIMSLVYGSIYWNISDDNFLLRVSAILVCLSKIGSGNMVELPATMGGNRVVLKQLTSNFYPPWIYVVGSFIVSLPVIIGESLIFTVILYWMCGSAPYALEFFLYFFVLFAQSIYLAAWFRFVASFSINEAQAQSIAGPSTGVFMIFGGFFVTEAAMPRFMVWVFWISPFSWSTRALANSEFLSARYDDLVTVDGELIRKGDLYLRQLSMLSGVEWIVYGVVFLLATSLLFIILQSFFLQKKWYEESIGTRRNDEEELIDSDLDLIDFQQPHGAVHEQHSDQEYYHQPPSIHPQYAAEPSVSQSQSSVGSNITNSFALRTLREKLPFSPTWLSFSNVRYTVQVKKDKEMVDRVLLDGVSGYAEPGKLTALMGASGAGKTTLLDVLAGRKNMGVMEGKILINSQEATPEQFAALAGYVEQFDTLFACSTVRETLSFAARLRLPGSVDDDVKQTIVDEVLDILDLTSIQHFIIGNAQIQGLSPSQLKRVNIGVELVANPAILFLDEPTTGLDSKSAQTVMRVVRRIARSGRSVICTIHQPSAELFFLFDRLVLLGSGGHQIYFGDLGRRCRGFIQYLSAIPGVKPIAPRYNPASWMLEELGVGVATMKEHTAEEEEVERRLREQDDPEWDTLTPQQRKVQRFKRAYFTSEVFAITKQRLHHLESLASGELMVKPVLDDVHGSSAIHDNKEPHDSTVPTNTAISASDDRNLLNLPTAVTPLMALSNTTSLWTQFKLLYARNFMGHYRNPLFIFSRLFSVTFISIIFGLVYLNTPSTDQSKVVGNVAAISMAPLFGCIIHGGSSLPIFIGNRAIFYRERSSGFYHPILWSLVSIGIEFFWCAIGSIAIQLPSYWLVGMKPDAGLFFLYLFAAYLYCLIFVSTSLLWTSFFSSPATANVINASFYNFITVFTGVSVPLGSVPRGWLWVFRMLPSSHFTEAVTMPQFEGNTNLIEIVTDGVSRLVTVEEYASEYTGYTYGLYWTHVGWMLLFFVVVQTLASTTSYCFIYNKR